MNWLYTLWFGYVYPSLKGNGPEAVVQTVVYAGLGYALYPPFRKWFHNELAQHHANIKAHFTSEIQKIRKEL